MPVDTSTLNTNDYLPSTPSYATQEEAGGAEEEEEVKVEWKEGYEVAILRLVPLMHDADTDMRRQVALW
jgi:hypothetical protein